MRVRKNEMCLELAPILWNTNAFRKEILHNEKNVIEKKTNARLLDV